MHRATRTGWQLLVPVGAGLAFLSLYGGAGSNRDGTPIMDTGNVDLMAHLFGLVAGVALGSVLFAAGLRRGARAWVQPVCGGAVIVVLAAAWMAASRM
jgi:membrane associated rhomboid family serine protease